MMAFGVCVSVRRWVLTFAILYVFVLGKNFGNADDVNSEAQTGGGFGGGGFGGGGGGGGGFGAAGGGEFEGGGEIGADEGGVGVGDPAQIVSKALLCFNDKYLYRSCEESFRLNENGNLNVPTEKTDTFCEGPCLSETDLVLHCLDNIFQNFIFYNKATIQDIRETIEAGCGYGPERGNFNVAEHIQTEENKAPKATNRVVMGFAIILMGRALLPLNFT